jgi:Zn-finger nucleic acid-binding protein
MQTVEVQQLHIDLCSQCQGSFYDHSELDRMFAVPDKKVKASQLVEKAPEKDLEQPINCPRCANPMERDHYFSGFDVLIDRCPEHGIWLDGGELPALLGHMTDSVEAELREQPAGFLASLKRLFTGG